MRTSARRLTAVLIAGLLASGVTACDNLPDIDPSNLPDISLSPRPSDTSEPAPVVTETEESEPAPVVTETEESTPSPEPEQPEEEGDVLWWPWVLLALVVLTIIIALAVKNGARSKWDSRLRKARAEFSWFEDSLIPQILSKPSAAEAQSLWQAGRPRVLDIDQELHELSADAPTDERTSLAGSGLAVLRSLTASLDEDTSTAVATDADALRARRVAVDEARAEARRWLAAAQR
ncbi:hypothetical protein [Demequina sediminicola]|uniref:hypothetical protein n=1 Tax=Demequina sediminicola TaxID=1095026 RepID=UPI0007845BB7|nr:hypothetical protein [Demequina sediminicola]